MKDREVRKGHLPNLKGKICKYDRKDIPQLRPEPVSYSCRCTVSSRAQSACAVTSRSQHSWQTHIDHTGTVSPRSPSPGVWSPRVVAARCCTNI